MLKKQKSGSCLSCEALLLNGKRILEREQTGELQFLPEAALEQHFIIGYRGHDRTFSLFNSAWRTLKEQELLKPLGEAVRVSYNVGDLFKICGPVFGNISEEDAARLGIRRASSDGS